jgi:hypothetical protein
VLLLAKLPVAEKLKLPAIFIVPEEEIVPEFDSDPDKFAVVEPKLRVPEEIVKFPV